MKQTFRTKKAQLVEQRTENPFVPGSIPGGKKVRLHYFFIIAFSQKIERLRDERKEINFVAASRC